MTLIVECIPCQGGDHERHITGWNSVPGRPGGWQCPCRGDCGERLRDALDELKFGPRSYTPEQAEVIERAVAERRPLTAPALPPEPAEGDEG